MQSGAKGRAMEDVGAGRLVSVIMLPVQAIWALVKVKLPPTPQKKKQKLGDRDSSLLDDYISSGWLPGP